MSSDLSEAHVEECKEAFHVLDLDHDGCISNKELGRLFRALGQNMPQHEIDAVLTSHDLDSDGVLNFEEFLQLFGKQFAQNLNADNHHGISEEVREAFNMFDTNHDGFLDAKELRRVFGTLDFALTDADVEAILKEAHVAVSGKISFAEFQHMILQPRS